MSLRRKTDHGHGNFIFLSSFVKLHSFFSGNYPVGSQEEMNFCRDEYIRTRLFAQVRGPAGSDGGIVRTLFSWFLRKLSNA